MKVLKFFKNKSLSFYLSLFAGVIGLVSTIFYTVYSLSVYGKINGGATMGNHFNGLVFTMLLLATLTCALPVIKSEWKFTTIVPAIFFSAAIGYYLNDRLVMFEEIINKIYGMMESGANFSKVIFVFILMLVSFISIAVSSFTNETKKIGVNKAK